MTTKTKILTITVEHEIKEDGEYWTRMIVQYANRRFIGSAVNTLVEPGELVAAWEAALQHTAFTNPLF